MGSTIAKRCKASTTACGKAGYELVYAMLRGPIQTANQFVGDGALIVIGKSCGSNRNTKHRAHAKAPLRLEVFPNSISIACNSYGMKATKAIIHMPMQCT